MVVLDVHMPVMDGLQAVARLRSLTQGAALPMIAVSAGVLSHEGDVALAAGFDSFVTKPMELAEVIAAIRQAIDKRSRIGAA